MRQQRKEFIRINLNRKKSLLESLRSLDLSTLKEFSTENLYPVIFLLSLAILVLLALVSLFMKQKINELNEQIAAARSEKDRVIAEIRALRNKINEIEYEQKFVEYLKNYNKTVIQEFVKAFQNPSGIIVQNVSLCAELNINEQNNKECDIGKATSVSLGKPVVQIDLVSFRENIDFKNYEILGQTYVEVGVFPIKRFCLQNKETLPETAKK